MPQAGPALTCLPVGRNEGLQGLAANYGLQVTWPDPVEAPGVGIIVSGRPKALLARLCVERLDRCQGSTTGHPAFLRLDYGSFSWS